jgi:hypothetical protein
MWKKWYVRVLLGLVAVFALIQLVPYGHDHANPSARVEPQWASAEVRSLAVRACFDCHSNQTVWPWYSHVAPVSWLLQNDTLEGREKLNFSAWNRPQDEADEAAEELRSGDMPMWYYEVPHPAAHLNDAEKEQLARGFTQMFGGEEGGRGGGERADTD